MSKSTIFQLWVEPVLSKDKCAQGHNIVTPVRLEPATTQSRIKHPTTEPPMDSPLCISNSVRL